MKKYYLFCGYTGSFYGGARNYQGCFGSIEEAKATHDRDYSGENGWWAHITDDDMKIQAEYYCVEGLLMNWTNNQGEPK
jgi:hypothetical protein